MTGDPEPAQAGRERARAEEARRLAAIMFIDVVGFTTMAQKDESAAMRVLEDSNRAVRSVVRAHGGREVKTMGDAFLIEFPSALAAVRCAVEIQTGAHEREAAQPGADAARLRIGIHIGDVIDKEGDIFGDAVNVSSRMEPLAEPGGVCVSGQVYDQVRNKAGLQLVKLTPRALKNVSLPIEVYRVLMSWEAKSAVEKVELDKRRVAVLPLRNMSPDPNDEYFAEGMTEELITTLAGINELTVIARTSVMQYKTAAKKVQEIGLELGAGTIIEGSVRKAGSKVRITVQLIDAQKDGHIWAQNYDRQMDDIFAIQSEIAEKVAETLRVKLLDSEKSRLEGRQVTDVGAYTLYLKGRHFWNERTEEGMEKAIQYFNEAVRFAPSFALGYSGLADCYGVMAKNGLAEAESSYRKAMDFATKALELDDRLAEPHAVLAGFFLYHEHDLKRAEAEYRMAIELNPNYASAHQWFSHLLGFQRRYDESSREIGKAMELDPLSLVINVNWGDRHYYLGELDNAIEQFLKVVAMNPSFPVTYPSLGQAYLRKSKFAEALKAFAKYEELTKDEIGAKTMKAYAYATMGRGEEAHRLLDEVERSYKENNGSAYNIGIVHFVLGEKDKGFEWLETAFKSYEGYIYSMAVDYEFDGVRSDPRYISLMKRLGF